MQCSTGRTGGTEQLQDQSPDPDAGPSPAGEHPQSGNSPQAVVLEMNASPPGARD